MTVRVGTSGWQYASWRGPLYPTTLPTGRWLAHYAGRFATVEVNATFYRLPDPARFADWASAVPDDFVLAVKASRYLTHIRRLRDPAPPVERLLEGTSRLGAKLGPVLLQLPPSMNADADRLDTTLACFPPDVRVAVEFRHRSWFAPEVRGVLERHGAALCLTDAAYRRSPTWRTAGFVYARLHRGLASPVPCYGRRALAWWADHIADLASDGADVFAYFNNDPGACAPHDAAVLAALCVRRGLPVGRAPAATEIRPR